MLSLICCDHVIGKKTNDVLELGIPRKI